MNEEKFFSRILECEHSASEIPLTTKVLENSRKYNCYMVVLQDLDLLQEYSEFKRRKKCQEES